MKKPIILISKVEVIEVEDAGSSVIECVQECHGELFPIGPADLPVVRQMNREIEYADVQTFTRYEDVTPEGMRPGTDILKTETKIAMTREVQMKLGHPFETIDNQSKEISLQSNTIISQTDQMKSIIDERDEFDRLYIEMLNMSIWSRVKFLLQGKVW